MESMWKQSLSLLSLIA